MNPVPTSRPMSIDFGPAGVAASETGSVGGGKDATCVEASAFGSTTIFTVEDALRPPAVVTS
jgi:hypothetical protein